MENIKNWILSHKGLTAGFVVGVVLVIGLAIFFNLLF